jgi:prepilin-type N-terminal cleavage/methylation domain-containing protein
MRAATSVMPPSARSRQAGFSLTEMMTALAIFALLGMTGVPIFSTIQQEYNLRGAVRRVYGEMQKARLAAITGNARYKAKVHSDGLVYLQEYDVDTGTWADLSKNALANDTPNIYVTGASEVVFSPDGTALSSAQFTVFNAVGMQKLIAVSRSGSIEIR